MVTATAPPLVLLVEDNPAMCALLRSLVESPGRAVRDCASGERALELYEELHPALVLMDLRMGGMDGLTATRAILRSDPAARVIIVTDLSDTLWREAARDAGATAFVAKHDLRALPSLVAAHCGVAS